MKKSTKKITLTAVLVALAMILSYVESLIPAFVAVPGVKIGLANTVTVFALYIIGRRGALCVSLVRVLLSSLLFGNSVSLMYSLSGALLSFLCMALVMRSSVFSSVGVSVVGGVMHNAGQILCAVLVLRTGTVFLYLPALVISGVIAGIVVGIIAGLVTERLGRRLR